MFPANQSPELRCAKGPIASSMLYHKRASSPQHIWGRIHTTGWWWNPWST